MLFIVEGQRGRFDELPPEEGLVSDMSEALGMNQGALYGNRGYQGWYYVAESNHRSEPESWPQKWTRNVWERLGEGDNIKEAIEYAISQQTNLEDPNAPVNNYRLKGRGYYPDIILGGD